MFITHFLKKVEQTKEVKDELPAGLETQIIVRKHWAMIKSFTNQHGLNGGHEWSLHSEEFPGSWTVGRLLLIPHHPIDHIAQITGGLEGIVGVWIHSIQAAWSGVEVGAEGTKTRQFNAVRPEGHYV